MNEAQTYITRVLRRTYLGLQDSLIPAHAAKLERLVDRLDGTPSLNNEINQLKRINGFKKCALSIQWLYGRVSNDINYESPEQFESDVLFLNEKIFEAFLNQPFELPEISKSSDMDLNSPFDLGTTDIDISAALDPSLLDPFSNLEVDNQAPADSSDDTISEYTESEPFEQSPKEASPETSDGLDLRNFISDDEINNDQSQVSEMVSEIVQDSEKILQDDSPASVEESVEDFTSTTGTLTEPDWTSQAHVPPQVETPIQSGSEGESPEEETGLSPEMIDSLNKASGMMLEYTAKNPTERLVAMAMLRMSAKSSIDTAKNDGNIAAQQFFENITKAINEIDRRGKVKSDSVAQLMSDIGKKLQNIVSAGADSTSELDALAIQLQDEDKLLQNI